jgi:hypothetical protein
MWICWLVYSYKTCSVDQSIDDIFLIALFLFYYLKIPRVEKAAVGLGSLA